VAAVILVSVAANMADTSPGLQTARLCSEFRSGNTLFSDLEASTSYEQFSSLVQQAQGSAGLMRFWQLDLDVALTLDPRARQQAGRRLVRLIAGNPVTMGR
jgi:hypothetical protein